MKTTTKNRTTALKQTNYISPMGDLNLTRLTDDAVAELERIEYHGVGDQRGRSRGVIFRSVEKIMTTVGYTKSQAWRQWREQIVPIFNLNVNAE